MPLIVKKSKAFRLNRMPRVTELETRAVPSTSIPLNAGSWTPIGPAPGNSTGLPVSGRTTAIAADPTDANTIYIGAASGGVWKTTNANSTPITWTPLTDGQAALTTGDIAIAPTDHNTVYVATGEPNNSGDSYYGRGVLRSSDGGTTWTLFNNGGGFDRRTMSRVVVSPADANTVYVAVYGGGVNGTGGATGVFRSTNGGTSWTNLTAAITTSTGFSDFEIDPSNPNLAYAAVGYAFGDANNGVYMTTNLQSSPPTWTKVSTISSGTANGRTLIAVSPSSPGTVYAEIDSSSSPYSILAFYQSTDSGVTWTDRVAGNAGFPVTCPNGQGWYDLGLTVDPSNPNTVIISGSSGSTRLQRSTDGGVTWSSLLGSGSNPHVDHHALAFDASGRLIDGDDGGVYRLNTVSPISWVSLNGAASGTATPTALDTNQFVGIAIHPTNANLAIGGTQDNGTLRFNDSFGWATVDGGDGGKVLWDVNNTNYLYRVSPVGSFGTGAFMRRSTNGGTSFSSIVSGIVNASNAQFYPPIALDPSAGSHRVFLGTNVVNVLADGTAASPVWSQYGVALPSSSSLRSIGIGAANPNTLYVGSNDGNVYVTTDGGATWQTRTPPSGGSWQDFAIDPSNSNIAYVVSDSFSGSVRIWKTTNAGGSWTSLMGAGLPNLPTSAVLLDPAGVLYVGNDQGVYRSTDSGGTWSRFGSGLPNAIVRDLEFSPALNILAAGTYGRGVWEILGTPTTTYADTHWAGLPNGTVIPDADPVATGNQTATVGSTAFVSVNAAIAAVSTGGKVVVNGDDGTGSGNFGEAVVVGKSLTLTLQAGPVTFGSLATTLVGSTLVLNGPLTTGGNNGSTQYDGQISGAGSLTKVGSGGWTLTRLNTNTGGVVVTAGTIKLGNGRALGAASNALEVDLNGMVDLNGLGVSVGALSGSGTITSTASGAAATLIAGVGNPSSVFGGSITEAPGMVALTKTGTGTLTLAGTSNYTGATAVNNGILLVDGTLSALSPVTVANGATLGGDGTVGGTSVAGVLAPGDGVGVLHTDGVTINNPGAFSVQFNSPAAGTGYSQLSATGPIDVTGATLVVTVAAGFDPPIGTPFDILVNNSGTPITGTFAGLGEGATFVAAGETYMITYHGGAGGNDVVLTRVAPVPPSIQSVQVNDGSGQRSEVRSIAVTFSAAVSFVGGDTNAAAAFQLNHIQTGNNVALATSVALDPQGRTVVTLTFSGAETDPVSIQGNANPVAGPSLADGRYTLTVFAANVTGPGGAPLAGGQPNGDFVSPPDSYQGNGLHLYRLFGDVNGDGTIDTLDLGQFRTTFNSNNSLPSYLAYLDADNNGAIDQLDLGQFRTRYNLNVF